MPHPGMDTQYTHHEHKWGVAGGVGGAHDALATRRTECGNGQVEGRYVPLLGKRPRK